jgi:hypothetical protein
MQRLFTMFPGGTPGLALVLLRLVVMGGLWQPILESGSAWSALRLISLGVLSVLLLFGFATPVVGLITLAIQLMRVLDPLRAGLPISAESVTVAIHAISALSLALLGPGAFSVDARLFGRRVFNPS